MGWLLWVFNKIVNGLYHLIYRQDDIDDRPRPWLNKVRHFIQHYLTGFALFWCLIPWTLLTTWHLWNVACHCPFLREKIVGGADMCAVPGFEWHSLTVSVSFNNSQQVQAEMTDPHIVSMIVAPDQLAEDVLAISQDLEELEVYKNDTLYHSLFYNKLSKSTLAHCRLHNQRR